MSLITRYSLITLLFLLPGFVVTAQKLNNILEGFTLNKVPTNRSVVGAKWVSGIGATTEGLAADQIIVSRSLNSYSFDKETNFHLQGAIKAILGIEGYSATDLEVIINGMEVESIKNLYQLNLVKDEMVIYEAVRAKSFDLVFDKNLEAGVKAKIPSSMSAIDIGLASESKKRITLDGADLYVAFKIIKVKKVATDKKTKKIGKEDYKVKDVMDYDVSFNINSLINHALKKTKEELGEKQYSELWEFSKYILKYSIEKPITISIVSESRGDMSSGIFKKVIDFCYCKSFGDIDGRMFLINTMNDGKKITFDYILIEDFKIVYDILAKDKDGNIAWSKLNLESNSKATIISKSYHISNVLN